MPPKHGSWHVCLNQGLLFPVVLGLFFTAGNYASQQERIPVRTPRFWLAAVFFVTLFVVFFAISYQWLEKAVINDRHMPEVSVRKRPWWKFDWKLSASSVARDAIRIFLCWMPVIFMVYPGVRGADTGDMIAMYLGYSALTRPAGTIWLHHPWLDTLLYGFAAKTSMNLTGSADLGLFCICLLQAAVAVIGFSLVLSWFASKGVSSKILTIVTTFIAAFPMMPYVAFNINKDMTYACFLVLYCALVFIILDDAHQQVLRNPAFTLFFLVMSVLVSLMARSGLIVVVLASILLACVTRSWRRRLLAAMAALMVLLVSHVVAPLVVYPRIHAIKGNTSAAFVAPSVMMARAASHHPDDLAPAQERIFESYFTYSWKDMGRRYTPFTADSIISPTGNETRQGTPSRQFVRLWLEEGRRHPLDYLEGYLLLESGWYSFAAVGSQPQYEFMVGVRENIFNPNLIVEGDAFSNRFGPVEKTWRSRIFQDLYTAQASVPGLNLFSMLSLYQSILPIFCLYALWRRRHALGGRDVFRFFVALAPWLLAVASMWFAAVSQSSVSASPSRFTYPSLYLAPLAVLVISEVLVRTSASSAVQLDHDKRSSAAISHPQL